jgi:bifunctional DNase/RNase
MRRFAKIGLACGLLIIMSLASAGNDSSPEFVEMEVKGVRIDPVAQSPVVILVDKAERRALPIWVGPAEASAIERELMNVATPRPMTHDLFHTVLGRLNAKVKEVKVVALRDQTFYGTLVLLSGKELIEIDARPSDAIVLALKSKAPISVATRVVESQGLSLEKKLGERQGIRVQELTPLLASQFNFKGKKGVLVSEVIAGSPAEGAGVKAGDIITRVDAKEVGSVEAFEETFNEVKDAKRVTISVFRDEKTMDVNLPLGP